MADSAVRFLLLSTTLWTLLQAPEIQAQSTSVLTITRSPFSVSPSSSLATPSAQTSAFSSNLNSTVGLTFASSIAAQSSSFLTNTQSTHSISSAEISTQSSASETIAPTSTTQQTQAADTSSTPASPSQSVTSIPTTKESKPDEDEKETFTLTEYILIACLGSFVFVLIAIIFLVVQIKRLSKSVRNLKATSNR